MAHSRLPSGTFIVKCTNSAFEDFLDLSDHIIAPLFIWLDQVGESDIVQIIVDQFVQSSPHGKSAAAVYPVTGNCFRGFQARYRCK
jgi:hypothetical protein